MPTSAVRPLFGSPFTGVNKAPGQAAGAAWLLGAPAQSLIRPGGGSGGRGRGRRWTGCLSEEEQTQELLGRLTTLDPEAGESLKVVPYFDTPVTAGAGLDALPRGAAALSGVVAGADRRGRISRRAPDGRTHPTEPLARSPQRACSVGSVWLERVGTPTPTTG